jgi:hypothetical protein
VKLFAPNVKVLTIRRFRARAAVVHLVSPDTRRRSGEVLYAATTRSIIFVLRPWWGQADEAVDANAATVLR